MSKSFLSPLACFLVYNRNCLTLVQAFAVDAHIAALDYMHEGAHAL